MSTDPTAGPTAGAAAALESPQVSVRLRAAMALGTWPDVAHLEAVVRRSAVEPDPFVRDTLAWVLTRLPAAPVLVRLRPVLDDPRPQARAQALHALSKVLDRSARPWITPELIADPDDVVARTAWRSALALTPREDLEDGKTVDEAAAERVQLAELLACQLGRGDEELQRALSRVLVQLGPAAGEVLERAVGSERPEVAAHAEAGRRLLQDPEAPFAPAVADVAAEQDDDDQLDVRPLQRDDVDFLRGLASDPRVVRFIGDGQPWSELYLQQRVSEALAGVQWRWFIARDASGTRVGLLSLRQREPGRVEVGYWVAPDHWGHGHAGRLLRHGVELCRLEGQTTVVARVRAGNGASQRVLVRGGFVESEQQDDPSLVLYEHPF